jgi:hypothetical protein
LKERDVGKDEGSRSGIGKEEKGCSALRGLLASIATAQKCKMKDAQV